MTCARIVVMGTAMLLAPGGGVGAQGLPDLGVPTHRLTESFSRVSSIRELPDGRVLILDARERRIVLADLERDEVHQVGRSGDGPGEYRQPMQLLAYRRDSTLVIDQASRRWFLIADGRIARTLTYASAPHLVRLRPPLRGVADDGRVLLMLPLPSTIPSIGGTIENTDVVALAATSLHAPRVDTLERLRGRYRGSLDLRRNIGGQDYVFANESVLGVEEQGRLFPDGWIAVVRVDPYRVEWLSPDARRTIGSTIPYERVRVTDREKRHAIRTRLRVPPPDIFSPEDFPAWPEWIPPIPNGALLPMPDGRLAIERRVTTASTRRSYDVVDRHGVRVGQFSVDLRSFVAEIGTRGVYVVSIDEDGVHTIARHPTPIPGR